MSRDLLIIHPGASHGIYGSDLAESLVAVEPPLWCRLIAGYIRDRGFSVKIIDAEALCLSPDDVAYRVANERPRLVCLAVYGHQPSASTQQMVGAGAIAHEIKKRIAVPIIMVGGHSSALPERTLREEEIDFVGGGEGPITILELLKGTRHDAIPGLVWWDQKTWGRHNDPAPLIEDLTELHGEAWDLLPMEKYRSHNWQCFGDLSKRQPYASIYTSLGCPYKCLAGDTLINTIHGDVPIKELAERYGDAGVPVYTFDPETRDAFITDSIRIRKYGEDQELVRVHFDDGTHIDCTPDHKFLQFKWGNGKSPSRQWECEAKDLPAGAHVRAMRVEINPRQRAYVTWARRSRRLRSRMIKDYEAGRRLERTEQVHHSDRDTLNDALGNLEHCQTAADHFARHPEIAERMRANNPTRDGMSQEWRDNLAAANRGKVRSLESRLRYRESKLGAKNPNFKHGDRTGTKSRRVAEVNHRVVRVEQLSERGDVYCLTVPTTGWFFANNVLVKNCSFCCINAPFDSNRYRMRDPLHVVAEVVQLYEVYGVRTIKIIDEMFVLNERHYMAIAKGLIASGIADDLNIWAYARVDTVKPETLETLRVAGIRWLALGIESGSALVRDGANKTMRTEDIVGTVKAIQAADINVIGNFIFGLRDDDHDTMDATYDLAIECMPDFANFYACHAYPGSALYTEAVTKGWTLPKTFAGFSQHNKWCRPLDTEHINGAEVLKYRDAAFNEFFSDSRYLTHVERKFGLGTRKHVEQMLSYKLERLLLDPSYPRSELEENSRPESSSTTRSCENI